MDQGTMKPQFDVTLGGSEVLPDYLRMCTFVASRGQEIQVMRTALNQQNSTKMAFQTIPKHMRRRAMSHNSKRLPRRLRQIHINQMRKSGMPVRQKRPSRRFRRRPRNLLKEYTRRANKTNRWLQTHIWHAKRFRMVEKWNYKLAERPCDKSFRACYRAVAKHCLVQDISYISCVEITGNRDFLLENFRKFQGQGSGPSFGAKAYESGLREGETTLFHPSSQGNKAIGPVRFQWKPSQGKELSTLWLWVHAAFYKEVLDLIISSFDLIELDDRFSNSTNNVSLKELNDKLCRFRLWGPLANAVLQNAFSLYEMVKSETAKCWIDNYVTNPTFFDLLSEQNQFWKSLKCVENLGTISPHIALSLVVKDPRLNFPKKRLKCVPEIGEFSQSLEVRNLAFGPIWDADCRNSSCASKISNGEITQMRSKLLVPGSDLGDDYRVFVPIMLVQRPGNRQQNLGFASGWDVILPKKWTSPFWLSINMHSARAGGLRESSSIDFEMGRLDPLLPDTEAGKNAERLISDEDKMKFFRKPPNKRTNFNKFNIASPFECNWPLLLKDWSDSSKLVEDFVVLRGSTSLLEVQDFFSSKTRFLPTCASQDCLVPIKIVCKEKGSPNRYSVICLPHPKDSRNAPIEPTTKDKYQSERIEMRKTHQSLLKKLRKRRIMEKKRSNKTEITTTKDILGEYRTKMRELWLPPAISIRKSCTREVLGFVTKGGFSFTLGQSTGVGFISSRALRSFLNIKTRNNILVRNTNSKQYRWAKLSVVLE